MMITPAIGVVKVHPVGKASGDLLVEIALDVLASDHLAVRR